MLKKFICSVLLLLPIIATSATPKNILVIGWRIDELITLDPAEIAEFAGTEYIANTYDRLVGYKPNETSHLYGVIADSWNISKDHKTYTFHLKKGLQFASKNPITAYDVAYSLKRVVMLNKSPAYMFTQFGFNQNNLEQTIKVIDDHTISLTTSKVFSPEAFLYSLSTTMCSIVDRNLLSQHVVDNDFGHLWLKQHYAGSGPFKLIKWTQNEILSLGRNNQHWETLPQIEKIIIRHIPETTTQELLLQKQDIDIARNVSPKKHLVEKYKITSVPTGNIIYMGLNQKNSYLKKPKVIEAIKWLIDYQGIINSVLKNKAVAHQSFIPKGMLSAIENTPYSLNAEKAKTLLKEAKLENGFTIKIDTTRLDLAQILKENFSKANINLEIIPSDNKQIFTKYRSRTHDIFIGTWGTDCPDPHANTSSFAYNPDNSNDAKDKTIAWRNTWQNESINNKTLTALHTVDLKERENLYRDIQQIIQKDAPFVFMFQTIDNFIMQPNVHGLITGPFLDNTIYHHVYKT